MDALTLVDWITWSFFSVMIAGFVVGIVVGLTGMGGGALMTPALIFLGVGDTATVVTADLTAAAVYKTGGAIVHKREGSPNMQLAKWLILGSVPTALLGPYLVSWFTDSPDHLDKTLKLCIGFALLLAAATYAGRLYLNLLRVRRGTFVGDDDPKIRPLPTFLVGVAGGLLVGITSVGSGSVIMICLLMLYPGLSAVKLVGTDLVQAVPLVLAAAISNIAIHGLDWGITVPLVLGSVPGTILGSKLAPRIRQSFIPPRHRRGADDVGHRAARQGGLGSPRRRRRRDQPDARRVRRHRHGRPRAAGVGRDPPLGRPADDGRPDRRGAGRPGVPPREPAGPRGGRRGSTAA
ncbi:sulfite exporter TauE/SafE family protein [Nocardioides daphniae]|uniref:sulfite exporter TauE/SafE family protein n=1 Tax=Nocardioides daphniae TaxID=402297 RepID=UPI001EE84240|nr:sulfite exporter TauE/SafE family protein [Nocardioides daphniae]